MSNINKTMKNGQLKKPQTRKLGQALRLRSEILEAPDMPEYEKMTNAEDKRVYNRLTDARAACRAIFQSQDNREEAPR